MIWRALLALVFGALVAASGFAQAVNTVDYSNSIGTSIVPCWPQDSARKTLYIANVGTANSVTYCLATGGSSTCTPSANSVGSYTLAPGTAIGSGGSSWWPVGSAPKEAGFCVASGSSSPIIVRSSR